jgi:hypothetical protein
LQGFFTVYIPDWGISLPGFSLHENNASGARWVEFPSKRSADGNGKEKWEKTINPYDTRQAKKFKEQLLKLLDEHRRDQEAQVEKECSITDPDSQE